MRAKRQHAAPQHTWDVGAAQIRAPQHAVHAVVKANMAVCERVARIIARCCRLHVWVAEPVIVAVPIVRLRVLVVVVVPVECASVAP